LKKEAEHQNWRERQVTRRLLQDKDDKVMQLLEVSQLDMEEAIADAKVKFDSKLKAEERSHIRLNNQRQHFLDRALKSKASATARAESNRRAFDAVIQQLKFKHAMKIKQMQSSIDRVTKTMDTTNDANLIKLKCMQQKLDTLKSKVHEERQRRRSAEQRTIGIRKDCQTKMQDMHIFLTDTEAQLKVSDKSCVASNTNCYVPGLRMESIFNYVYFTGSTEGCQGRRQSLHSC
jgi:hypothetical protein